jgi:hypothetical protein
MKCLVIIIVLLSLMACSSIDKQESESKQQELEFQELVSKENQESPPALASLSQGFVCLGLERIYPPVLLGFCYKPKKAILNFQQKPIFSPSFAQLAGAGESITNLKSRFFNGRKPN